MKMFIGALLLFYSSFSFAQSNDVEALKKLNEDWIHSYPGKDTATLSKIFADDMIMITPNGTRMSKKEQLINTASPGQQIESANVDSVEVRLLGNVGLVMAKASFVSKAGGKEMTGQTCYLDVYEKRNGKWVAVAAHVTLLGMK